MTVIRLIWALLRMPLSAKVGIVTDGGYGHDVERIYLSRSGVVCVCQDGEPIYNDEDRPANAPSEKADKYWCIQ